MSMTMTAAPAAEPITLAEAKAHLRMEGNAEDSFISSLVITSRLQIEAALGLALVTQSWRVKLDDWPAGGEIELAIRPVQSVEMISVSAVDGSEVELPPDAYIVDGQSVPARIVLTAPPAIPQRIADGIKIDFTVGFGDATQVPSDIKQALLLLVAHWYENREPVSSGASPAIPQAVSSLLAPYRVVRV